ncbi:MAG TPA: HD domain-containing protein [Clostridia bacterium]|nr:HD domain-containing protein [Clostridia bacterium]
MPDQVRDLPQKRVREAKEDQEATFLSPFASRAALSQGRLRPEEPCQVRTAYERDVGRILYSLPFRRLRHKTQVFFDPQNDHVCTRMEHVLYVSYLAETIGKALGLNTDLIRAIALGHDLGHAPFGHAGEATLNQLIQAQDQGLTFSHEQHGLRVVDLLSEHKGRAGLNLTFEVRDGIASHCGERYDEFVLAPAKGKQEKDLIPGALRHDMPATLEGCLVRLADRMAYVGRDIEDATRSGLLYFDELPGDLRAILGHNNSEIVDTLVKDVIEHSLDQEAIIMSQRIGKALQKLIEINYEKIYLAPRVRRYEIQVGNTLEALFEYYLNLASQDQLDMSSPAQAFADYVQRHPDKEADPVRIVTDYIAGMTDPFAGRMFKSIFGI